MPTVVQLRRGTTAQNTAFTGAAGELTFDTTLGTLRVHDNSTAGGNVLVAVTATQTLTNKTIPVIAGVTTITGNLVANSATASTSTTTGALVVVGGVGVSGAIYAGTATTSSTLIASGNVVAASGTASTSATTGALVVVGGAGISGNVFTSGWVVPTANVSQNLGTTTSWWGTFYGVSTQAKYADLAENYNADTVYDPGTVLVFGGTNEVTTTITEHDTRVAGVVSTNPAHLMNGGLQGETVVALGLTGRLPCKVLGPVNNGDVLVTSNVPGVAKRIDNSKFLPGCVVGKALQSILIDEIELIEIVVGRF